MPKIIKESKEVQENSRKYKNPSIDFIPIITDGDKYQVVQQWQRGVYADTVTLDSKGRLNGTIGISGCNMTIGAFANEYKHKICDNALFVDATSFDYVNKCPWFLDYKLDITLPDGMMQVMLEQRKFSSRERHFNAIAIDVWVKLLRQYTKGIRLGRYFNNKLVWESTTLGLGENEK